MGDCGKFRLNQNLHKPETVAVYQQEHVEYRRRLDAFWQRCRGRPHRETTRGLRHLLRRFACWHLDDAWWQQQCRQWSQQEAV